MTAVPRRWSWSVEASAEPASASAKYVLDSPLLHRALAASLPILAILHLAVLIYHLGATVAFPFDLDYGEGYVLNDAVRLARGEAIYGDIQRFPMVRSPYPPLFPWLWSSLVPLAGPVFWPGRLLSGLALAAVLVLVTLSAAHARAGRLPLFAALGVVAGSPMLYQWAGYARVDMLAVACSAAAVLVAQAERRHTVAAVSGQRGIWLAAALCLAALWTKQTSVAAPVAIWLALLVRDRHQALQFVGLIGVPSLLLALALHLGTQGEFTRHVLLGNLANPFQAGRMVAYLLVFAALHLPLLAGAGWWSTRNLRGGTWSPLALYVPLTGLSAAAVGNEGSSVNYFLEPLVASAIAIPLAWRSLPSHARMLGPGLAALQLLIILHWPNTFGTDYLGVAPHGRTPTEEDYGAALAVDAAVVAAQGGVLAEAAGFSVRNGLPVWIQPIDLRAEQVRGRWDSGPLVEALGNGRFALVVTSYELLPHDAESAIDDHFVVDRVIRSPNGLTYRLYGYRG